MTWKKKVYAGEMFLLPPAPHLCPACAVEHAPDAPHNAQSFYYGVRFKMMNGYDPNWGNALAHCDDLTRKAWEAELRARGVPERDLKPNLPPFDGITLP